MALKRKLSKEDYDKLPEALKSEYKERGGEYFLDVDGDDDNSALKRAKDREKQRAEEAERKAKELQDKLDEIEDNKSRNKGDFEKLEKKLKETHAQELAAEKAKAEKLQAAARKHLIDGTAATLATKLSTVPSLLSKVIKERLTVDFEGDEPALTVLDKDGKPSTLKIEDLEKEILANKEFASILIGSKANGGGASKDGLQIKRNQGGGAADDKPVNLAQVSASDLAAALKARKENEGA